MCEEYCGVFVGLDYDGDFDDYIYGTFSEQVLLGTLELELYFRYKDMAELKRVVKSNIVAATACTWRHGNGYMRSEALTACKYRPYIVHHWVLSTIEAHEDRWTFRSAWILVVLFVSGAR